MIIVDTREPTKKIGEILSTINFPYEFPEIRFEKLDHGDYYITGKKMNLLISRKTISDFCQSYILLHKQLKSMRELGEQTALMIEGTYIIRNGKIYLFRGNMLCPACSYLTYSSFLLSQQKYGTFILNTFNLEETILRILMIHKKLNSR